MLVIDGSEGEGGGQMLRSSLALSLLTGQPFRIEKVRAGRRRPGLLRQHLTCVRAAAAISDAEVCGASLGSTCVELRPRALRGGVYHFEIGTAGSVGLVVQAVLPALLRADAPSEVHVAGGTHVPFAPVWDFVDRVYAPLLRRMGARIELSIERPGFLPAGGGRVSLRVGPIPALAPIELLERGEPTTRRARVYLAHLPQHIAAREIEATTSALGWGAESGLVVACDDAISPGNVVVLEIGSEHITELISSIGEKRLPAEVVAGRAVSGAKRYLASCAPVGVHLADQLLLPMALAGAGVMRTVPLSLHARTNIRVIERFLPVTLRERREGERTVVIEVEKRSV